MKMRSLRRKKKTEDNNPGGGFLAAITTPMKNINNNNNRNNNNSQQKGFRRRIPSQVVVTSPLSRFRNNYNSSSNSSRAMSGLTEEEEEDTTTTAPQDRLIFVTREKMPPCSWAAVTPRTSNSSFTTSTTSQWEEIGLVGSVQEWVDALGCLLNSQEFQRLLHTSGHLMLSAGGAAVRTACLPVTVPLHVANHTTRFVVGQAVLPILGVTQLLLQQQPDAAAATTTPTRQSVREDEDTPDKENEQHPKNPIAKVVRGVWCLPGHVFGLADHVKNEIGGVVLRTLAPPLHGTILQESCSAGEPTSEAAQNHAHVLERLRLDYGMDPAVETTRKEPVKMSQFLLRIDDLRVMDEEKGSLLHYVDLNALEHPVVLHALDRMVHVGLSLIANHPTVRLSNQPHVVPREQEIEWKPEGNTFKLLRRLSKLDVLGRLDMLRKETLVWSGRFQNNVQADYDRQSRFYLARGVLNMSPRALLDLLWDNSRTSEYNKFCLGRTTFLGNDLEFLQGLDKTGTKVIQSETRVPLTSISVTVTCLMHARALPDNSGYIIISRSCNTGPQGVHHEPLKNVSRPKNEIHWGVNILRRVPHREDCVDLTSHSQVGTAGVPQFLAAKIALMGVEGFFENARKLAR